VRRTTLNYVFEKVGNCLGEHHAGEFDTVSPAEQIQPWDVVMVRPREGTLISELLTRDGVDALGKIFLGRTEHGVHLATLNPPAVIDLPLEEIEVLHRIDGGLGLEHMTPHEQGAILFLSQYNTGEPIAPFGDWRPQGAVGLSAFTGEMMTRYASRNVWGAALGPSAEVVETVGVRLPGAFLSDEWTAGDTRAFRKLLPFQNLFYIRRMLDQIEGAYVNSALGVPKSRTVTKR
jgi:hypothetical protein